MMEWIKTLNKMYAEHPYTDSGRVVVTYCAEMDVVVVKVAGIHNHFYVIECEEYNERGILWEIQSYVNGII